MNEGWKCPNCGKAHAPWMSTCDQEYVTWTTNTFDECDKVLEAAKEVVTDEVVYERGTCYTLMALEEAIAEAEAAEDDDGA